MSQFDKTYLYKGNSNIKIELQFSYYYYYDHCLSYIYIS